MGSVNANRIAMGASERLSQILIARGEPEVAQDQLIGCQGEGFIDVRRCHTFGQDGGGAARGLRRRRAEDDLAELHSGRELNTQARKRGTLICACYSLRRSLTIPF